MIRSSTRVFSFQFSNHPHDFTTLTMPQHNLITYVTNSTVI